MYPGYGAKKKVKGKNTGMCHLMHFLDLHNGLTLHRTIGPLGDMSLALKYNNHEPIASGVGC